MYCEPYRASLAGQETLCVESQQFSWFTKLFVNTTAPRLPFDERPPPVPNPCMWQWSTVIPLWPLIVRIPPFSARSGDDTFAVLSGAPIRSQFEILKLFEPTGTVIAAGWRHVLRRP